MHIIHNMRQKGKINLYIHSFNVQNNSIFGVITRSRVMFSEYQ